MSAVAVILLLYVVFIRPWHLRWGATEAEIGRPMPGDEIVQSPDFDATRAVGIAASPDRVWRLLERRAGEILVRRGRMPVWERQVEPGRWIVWRDPRRESSWSWQVQADGDGGTRLVARQRARYHWRSPRVLLSLVAEVSDVVAVRAGLLDIKRQAERDPSPTGSR